MRIGVVTDSTAGITKEQASATGIKIVPLKLVFNSTETYLDGELSEAEFMTRLRDRSQTVGTSAPDPGAFLSVYEELVSEGIDHIVSIHISTNLSEGTKNASQTAQRVLNEKRPHVKVLFWDSKFNSIGTGWQALEAAQLAKKGASPDQIKIVLEDMRNRTVLRVVVDGLWYLHRGGRVSRVVQVGADMLDLKPIFGLKDGKTALSGQVRRLPKAVDEMVRRVCSLGSLERLAVSSETGDPLGDELVRKLGSEGLVPYVERVPLSSVLAVHTGPQAFGFVALKKGG